MINNYTYNILPFYSSVSFQNHKNKYMYDDLCTAPLICSHNRLLPFQIYRQKHFSSTASIVISLYCFDDTLVDNITADIPSTDLLITTAGSRDYITYRGNIDLTTDLPAGYHYLKVTDGINTWYSEIFKVVCFDFITIKRASIGNGLQIKINATKYIKFSN